MARDLHPPELISLGAFAGPLSLARRVCVGFSGGVDSTVLLHALTLLKPSLPIRELIALHINHGLSREADRWAELCREQCQTWNVPYHEIRVAVGKFVGTSLEEEARISRYQALKDFLQPGDLLAIAHHEEDQAETFLLQCFRGAGIKGLSSMPVFKAFGPGQLIRPLLDTSKAEILAYAEAQQLTWIEDESNEDTRWTRNFLRREVIPLLRTRWPSISSALARVACHCREGERLLEELAEDDLAQLQGSREGTLSICRLRQLSWERQKNALRAWIVRRSVRLPSTVKLDHILRTVLGSRQDAQPVVAWEQVEVRRYRNNVYLNRIPASDARMPSASKGDQEGGPIILPWDLKNPLDLPQELGRVIATRVRGKGLKIPRSTDFVTVRFRCGGKRLKKIFQAFAIPQWERCRIPLIYLNHHPAAIAGWGVIPTFRCDPDGEGYDIHHEKGG